MHPAGVLAGGQTSGRVPPLPPARAPFSFVCCSKWLEERRKDYVEMMLHHVLTVWLILNSFVANELPIGLVVLACHDISDVALDLMKMVTHGSGLDFGCSFFL